MNFNLQKYLRLKIYFLLGVIAFLIALFLGKQPFVPLFILFLTICLNQLVLLYAGILMFKEQNVFLIAMLIVLKVFLLFGGFFYYAMHVSHNVYVGVFLYIFQLINLAINTKTDQ